MEIKMATLAQRAQRQAAIWHADTNHLYAGYLPYAYHLNLVGQIGKRYLFLIPADKQETVSAALYLHDTIEDARKSYNDIVEEFGNEVADLVYAVTNNTGKTRNERADAAYYEKIRTTPYAVFVKLCDRMANALHGVIFGGTMLNKYRKEHEHFVDELWHEDYVLMFTDLKELMDTGTIRLAIT